ncbi:MAG: hypothetical protein R3D05_08665 [Dongiaceae bacterium]
MPDTNHDPTKRPYPADKARGGEIILRSRWQRVVFIAGLVGAVLIGLVLSLWAG